MTSFTESIFSTADDQTAVSSSPLIGPNESITTASIIRSGHLPTPRLGIIGEIEKAIKALARTQAVKERICEYIQQEVVVTVPRVRYRD
jgi:protein phosphatase-4 regulatory subunit 3